MADKGTAEVGRHDPLPIQCTEFRRTLDAPERRLCLQRVISGKSLGADDLSGKRQKRTFGVMCLQASRQLGAGPAKT